MEVVSSAGLGWDRSLGPRAVCVASLPKNIKEKAEEFPLDEGLHLHCILLCILGELEHISV